MDPEEINSESPDLAGPGTPAAAPGPEPDSDDREQCVPVAALAMPDDQEQMAPPEVGDKVSYQVEGTVTRVEGDEAYVQPESINGQEVGPKEAEPTPDEQDQADYQDLQGAAQQQGSLA